MYQACFNSDAGKRVLEHLDKVFKGKNVMPTSDVYFMGVRDGRRDVIQQIKEQLK